MERLVFMDISHYVNANSLLSVWQSGFKPGSSTVTHCVELYHTLCQSLEKGKDARDFSRHF